MADHGELRDADQRTEDVEGYTLIERAIGVLIAQGAADADDARLLLRRAASRDGVPLAAAAREVLDQAYRRSLFAPARLANAYAEMADVIGTSPGERRLRRITLLATERVRGVVWASVTLARRGGFHTVAATHPEAEAADQLQYDTNEGPCLAALAGDRPTCVVPALVVDDRWPHFARRAMTEVGVGGVLSYRLTLEVDADVTASLNLYANRPESFDETGQLIGVLLATHASGAIVSSFYRDRAAHLERALESNREIGMAMGILMHQHQITGGRAFDLLRIASQHGNRKLRELATEVVDTGTLPLPPGRWRQGGASG